MELTPPSKIYILQQIIGENVKKWRKQEKILDWIFRHEDQAADYFPIRYKYNSNRSGSRSRTQDKCLLSSPLTSQLVATIGKICYTIHICSTIGEVQLHAWWWCGGGGDVQNSICTNQLGFIAHIFLSLLSWVIKQEDDEMIRKSST